MDILDIEEVQIESFNHLLLNLDNLKLFHVSDNEIKVLNTHDNRILKIDKGKLIESMFSMPHKDDPINIAMENNDQNQMPNKYFVKKDFGGEGDQDNYDMEDGMKLILENLSFIWWYIESFIL